MDIYCSRKYDKRLVEKTLNEIEYYLMGLNRDKERAQFKQQHKIKDVEPSHLKGR
jgi:hypothetical protein